MRQDSGVDTDMAPSVMSFGAFSPVTGKHASAIGAKSGAATPSVVVQAAPQQKLKVHVPTFTSKFEPATLLLKRNVRVPANSLSFTRWGEVTESRVAQAFVDHVVKKYKHVEFQKATGGHALLNISLFDMCLAFDFQMYNLSEETTGLTSEFILVLTRTTGSAEKFSEVFADVRRDLAAQFQEGAGDSDGLSFLEMPLPGAVPSNSTADPSNDTLTAVPDFDMSFLGMEPLEQEEDGDEVVAMLYEQVMHTCSVEAWTEAACSLAEIRVQELSKEGQKMVEEIVLHLLQEANTAVVLWQVLTFCRDAPVAADWQGSEEYRATLRDLMKNKKAGVYARDMARQVLACY